MPGDPHSWGPLRVYGHLISVINDNDYPKLFISNTDKKTPPDTYTNSNDSTNKNAEVDDSNAKGHNKLMHTTNGNTVFSDFNVIQLNSGNGKWTNNDNLLMASIEKHAPDIVVISESNVNTNDDKMITARRSRFKDFTFLDKVFQGTHNARLTVMVRNKYEFERKVNLENEINPTMVITIKTSSRRSHTIVANYRQWKGTAPSCNINGRLDAHAVLRFTHMTKIWESAVNLGNPTTIVGDINIDRHEPNDPEARPDIKNLIPILKDFQSKFNITLVNHEPTRYRHGQRPSLLDLILTTNPQNITDIVNVPNFCSEHMGVLCKIRI